MSKYTEGDIVTFKLVNGDEAIAKIITENDVEYIISRPCMLVPAPQGIGLMQALLSVNAETTFALQKSHVLLHGPTNNNLSNHYIEVTTGIKLSDKAVLMG